MKETKYTSSSYMSNALLKPSVVQNKLKNEKIPIKNFIFSCYSSNSNSFRQGKFKTAKASPEKTNDNPQKTKNTKPIESKEIIGNAMGFMRKKIFSKKSQSNYLNYTNPVYQTKKFYNRENSKSISINNSLLMNNIKEDIKVNRGGKGNNSCNHQMEFSKKNNKGYLSLVHQRKKIAQTAFNSRKNSIDKMKNRINNKIVALEKSKEITISNNTVGEGEKVLKAKNEGLKTVIKIEVNKKKDNSNIISKPRGKSTSKNKVVLSKYKNFSIKSKAHSSSNSKPKFLGSSNISNYLKLKEINYIGEKGVFRIDSLLKELRNASHNIQSYISVHHKELSSQIMITKEKKKHKHNRNPTPNSFLNNTNTSMLSTMRDSNYYNKEAQILSMKIKDYYKKNKKYPETDLSFYKYGRVIGKGAFGKVNLGLNILTGRVVAIKSFNKKNITNDVAKAKILYETMLMRKLCHPSITKILEMFESNKYTLIIMEYISGGNLQNFVRKRQKLNEKTAKILFKQIIEGIQYIHSMNIVHRDIKPENILIDLNNNIKICDFGVGKKITSKQLLFDQCGTPVYMAPEILKNEGYEGYPVDIWSAGVVLYMMLSGCAPFNKTHHKELKEAIIKENYKPIEGISDQASSLIAGLLNKDPKKRLTAKEVLLHPWLYSDEAIDTRGKLNVNKFHLFTNAEMILLAKTHVDYRNASKEELKEIFTSKNLITEEDKKDKNSDTKSFIFTPYNSDIYPDELYGEDNLDIVEVSLKTENDIMKFCGKVKELNINYELNNNKEINNGQIISYKANNQSKEINNSKIESIDNNNYNNNDNGDLNSNRNKRTNEMISSSSNSKLRKVDSIIDMVVKLGYHREYVLKCIDENKLCQATAVYYLFLNYENVK